MALSTNNLVEQPSILNFGHNSFAIIFATYPLDTFKNFAISSCTKPLIRKNKISSALYDKSNRILVPTIAKLVSNLRICDMINSRHEGNCTGLLTPYIAATFPSGINNGCKETNDIPSS